MVSRDEVTNIKKLVGLVTGKHRMLPSALQSPYFSAIKSSPSPPPQPKMPRPPSAPQLKHNTVRKTPHPPSSASTTTRISPARNCAVVKRPQTAPEANTSTFPLRPHFINSNVLITLCYEGRTLKLDGRRGGGSSCEVLVVQQHCGGNTLIVFKGWVKPKRKYHLLGANWC